MPIGEWNRAVEFDRVIENVANQQSEALRSNSAASDVDLAQFDLRIIRAMQSSALPRRDG